MTPAGEARTDAAGPWRLERFVGAGGGGGKGKDCRAQGRRPGKERRGMSGFGDLEHIRLLGGPVP